MKLAGPVLLSSASFVRELEPLRLEAALVLAHVGELLDRLRLFPILES